MDAALLDSALSGLKRAEEVLRETSRRVGLVIDDVKVGDSDGRVQDACRRYYHMQKAYEALNKERVKIFDQLELMSRNIIPELMYQADTRDVSLEDIDTKFLITSVDTASVLDKERVMEWLREIGADDMITETVNSSSLSAFCREYMREHHMDPPEDCIRIKNSKSTSMRSLKTKG